MVFITVAAFLYAAIMTGYNMFLYRLIRDMQKTNNKLHKQVKMLKHRLH